MTKDHASPYPLQVRARSILFAVLLFSSCSRDEKEAVPHVRLGMAPRDVRERFVPGGEGTWHTGVGTADDTVLEWTASGGGAPVAHAKFEFHLGMLVAVRAELREKALREEVSATPKTVTLRAPAKIGSTVTVLARDCPTHKDEAEGLAAQAK